MTNHIKENVPLLNAIGLKKYYPVKKGFFTKPQLVKALDGVSFQLERGKTLAVVGESGCGKSTLGRLLAMIEQPTEGELYYNGQNFLENNSETKALRRKKIQIVFQNPYASLNPRKKIGSILEEPLIINTKLSAQQRKEKVLSIMEKVGLRPEFYDRYPHMFSGGQRQRIAIARGLMLEPDIVVADEPVSALDVSVRAQVLNLMMDLQDDLGLSYVFISHDLSVVKNIQLMARSNLQVFDSRGLAAEEPLVTMMNVAFNKTTGGSFKNKEATEHSDTFQIMSIKQVLGGKEILFVDVLANIYRVNGQDVLQKYRTNIGQ